MPTRAPTNVNIYSEFGLGNMLIMEYPSLSLKMSHQIKRIWISLTLERKKKDAMYPKWQSIKTLLKRAKLEVLIRWSLLVYFIYTSSINYWEGLDWCKVSSGIEAQWLGYNPELYPECPRSKWWWITRKSFTKASGLCSFCWHTDTSTPLKHKLNVDISTFFAKFLLLLRMLKQTLAWGLRTTLRCWQMLVFQHSIMQIGWWV